ncbi:transposase [Candidatus Halobeggiatoa sp. HSG11]|nr:transposase [Candidatus Halobeggiatoa sp. HSG11]
MMQVSFTVFDHVLCWIHAERIINRLIPLNENHEKAVNWVREQIWQIYADIKCYKTHQEHGLKEEIQARFEELCHTETCYESLNQALKRLGKNQHELLRVLEKPWIPVTQLLSVNEIFETMLKSEKSAAVLVVRMGENAEIPLPA